MAVGRLIISLVVGSIVLNVLGPLRGLSEKRMGAYEGMLPGLRVEITPENQLAWLIKMSLSAILLEVIVPGVIYAIVVQALGRSGVLVGMLFWGAAWLIGALPQHVFEPMLINVPRRFVVHNVMASLLIYLIIGAVVGAIYTVG